MVLLFLMLPMQGIPLAAGVYVVAAIAVVVAYPIALAAVAVSPRVFRLLPAAVPIPVALDAYAVVAVGVAALVSAGGSRL